MNHATDKFKEHIRQTSYAEDDGRKVIAHYLFEPGDGGLDRVAILLANGMAERGRRSELWMTESDGPVAPLISDKVTVRIVPSFKVGSRGFRIFTQIPALARMIRKHRPAVLISAGNQTNLSITLARAFAGGDRPQIVQKITNPINRPGMNKLRSQIRRIRFGITARLGDRCLTLSNAEAAIYREMLPAVAERFHPVRNAYVTPEMLALGRMRSSSRLDGPAKLLAIGRISYQKDYETMLRALAKLADRTWTLTILGDGPLMERTKALASELKIDDRIEFAGFVGNPAPYLASANLLILSSRWEGFPAVPLEAMATGCGVVATDCSVGLSELLLQTGARTTPIGDSHALAAAISSTLDSTAPFTAGSAIASHYSTTSSVDDHLRLLDDLIA